MKNIKVKILAIDDNNNNLIKLKQLIEEAFPFAITLTTNNGKKGLELAEAENPDVILLDILMPGMDGFEVCQELKAKKNLNHIPIVLVSVPKGNRENRIKALEAGAEAFITKPIDIRELTAQIKAMMKIKNAAVQKLNEKKQLAKLVIEQTKDLKKNYETTLNLLENSKIENETRKLSEKALRESEKKYRSLTQSTIDAIITTDMKRKIVDWNIGAEKIFGYFKEEIIGKDLKLLIPQSFLKILNEEMNHIEADRDHHASGKTVELYGLNKYGKEFPIELSLSEWEASGKKYFTGIIRDISSRKAAEEEIQFRNIILSTQQETSIDGILVVDENSEIVSYNSQFIRMWGIPQELADLKSDEPVLNFVAEQMTDPQSFIWQVQHLYEHKNETCHEQIILKNGNIFDRYSAPMVGKDEKYYGRVWYFRDITERKRFENALMESEERLRITMEVTNIGLWNWDVEKDIWNASPTYYTMLGYEPVIGPVDRKAWLNLVHPDDRQGINDKINKVLHGRIIEYNYKARIKHADGSYRWNSVIGKTVEWDSYGAPKSLIGVRIDITKQKEDEERIHKSEKRYRYLFENTAIAIWEEDLSEVRKYIDELRQSGVSDFRSYFDSRTDEVIKCASMVKLLDVNNEGVNIFEGSSKEEIIKCFSSFFVEESLNAAKEELVGLSEGKLRIEDEMPIKTLNGRIKQILFQLIIVPGYEDTWSRVLFSFLDITERKKDEQSLRLFRLLIDRSNDAVEVIDTETGRFIDVNEKACSELGYSRNELLNMQLFDIDPNQILKDFKLLVVNIKESDSMMIESTHRRKDGSIFPVEVNITAVNFGKKYTIAIVRNITDRKIAEKVLAASEERYRLLFQSAAEGIIVVDIEKKEVKFANNAACEMFGYTEEEITGLSVKDMHPPESLAYVISEFKSQAQEGKGVAMDIPCLRKDGAVFYCNITNTIAEIDGSKHNIGFATDITAQKKSVEKTKFLAHALESINECITITDLNDNLTFVNSAFCKVYGYKYNDVVGKNISIFRSENNPVELTQEILPKTLSGGWQGELLNKKNTGEEFPVYLYTSIIYDDKNNPVGLLGVSSDISERKVSEEALRYQQYLMDSYV